MSASAVSEAPEVITEMNAVSYRANSSKIIASYDTPLSPQGDIATKFAVVACIAIGIHQPTLDSQELSLALTRGYAAYVLAGRSRKNIGDRKRTGSGVGNWLSRESLPCADGAACRRRAVADDIVPHGTIHLMFEFPASGKPTHTTQAVVVGSDAGDDWALLKCIAPPQTDPIALASRNQPREEWHSLGYPKVIDGRQFQMDGYIVTTHAQIPTAKNPAIQLFSQQLAAGKGIDIQGFSGAPIVVERPTDGLIGQPKFVAAGVCAG